MATVRNIAIIVAIAALVVLIPGGGTGANVAFATVRIAFYATIGWAASVMYRQYRTTLYALGDRRRAILYAAIAVGAFTLTATSRLWQTSTGSVAWLALMAGAVYAVIAVVWSARRY